MTTSVPPTTPVASHLAAALRAAESLCIKCGFCLPACPTYRETGIEAASPRGRLDLMYAAGRGQVELAAIEPALALCLGCQACETACPSGIRYHDMLEAERADVAAYRRNTLGRRIGRFFLNRVLLSPRVLRAVIWGLWAYQHSGAQALVRATRVLWIVPPLARMERRAPPVSRPVSWRKDLAQKPVTLASNGRATMLTGCIMDAAFGEVHSATVYVLRAHGVEVVDVPAQGCCGALHLHAGEVEQARVLARQSIAAFEAAGEIPIVVNSAGCGAAMKGYGALLAEDVDWAERARRFAGRVRDVSEYVASLPPRTPSIEVPLNVAYDDPCHLAHAQKLRDPPRELLGRVPGLRPVPLREADMCCGSAGSYSLLEPAMSAQVLRRKMEHIAASGAQVVATGNPGCLMQLRLGVREKRLSVRVVHPIELLAAGFGWRAPGS